ncbi:MAG: hypothetical protein ACRCWI_03475 [Brevinema sp.]
MKKLHKIYQMFLEHPHLNACPVFQDQKFLGILLKKDLENQLSRMDADIEDLIIQVPVDHLEQILFHVPPHVKTKIPYINKLGILLGALLYDEFVSEFFPRDFVTKLSFHEIFNYYEYPVLILNQFKTILYLNYQAQELLTDKVFGMKISDALLAFDISVNNEQEMILRRQEESWRLIISKSITPYAQYYVYQCLSGY